MLVALLLFSSHNLRSVSCLRLDIRTVVFANRTVVLVASPDIRSELLYVARLYSLSLFFRR